VGGDDFLRVAAGLGRPARWPGDGRCGTGHRSPARRCSCRPRTSAEPFTSTTAPVG
jgi:hypothetical protein